jgi:hypothetical protein
VLGAIEYRTEAGQPRTVASVQEYVANQGDAWGLALDAVAQFQEEAAAAKLPAPVVDSGTFRLLELARQEPETQALSLIGPVFWSRPG